MRSECLRSALLLRAICNWCMKKWIGLISLFIANIHIGIHPVRVYTVCQHFRPGKDGQNKPIREEWIILPLLLSDLFLNTSGDLRECLKNKKK
jgi:hypothetical protein